ncbi:hypothetical protein HHI36_020251, partial [Cryptolaemus montrouzieri]
YSTTELQTISAEYSIDQGEFVASDNKHDYIPLFEDSGLEISDVEPKAEIENEIDSYDSDASFEGELFENIFFAEDGTLWQSDSLPRPQTCSRNIIRQRAAAVSFSELNNQMEIFKNVLSNEMCDIVLRKTNRKGTKITEAYNTKLMENFLDIKRPKQKIFKPFTE